MSRDSRRVSNQVVARQGDGVHQELRTAASAKFFYEIFPGVFASSSSRGELPDTHAIIEELYDAFRALYHDDAENCEEVISYTKAKIAEQGNNWDKAHFYSRSKSRRIDVDLPLGRVLAAIATLVLDKGNHYFSTESDPAQAHKGRLNLLFGNLKQLKDAPGLCHTGVRDAFITVMNGVTFQCGDETRCYRFPENLPAYLQSLQVDYIQKALSDYKASEPDDYRLNMIAWVTLPELEREMPKRLKAIVVDYINAPTTQVKYRESLLSVGMNPDAPQASSLYPHFFAEDALEAVDFNAAIGSAAYWHDVDLIFKLTTFGPAGYSCILSQIKTEVRACSLGGEALHALHDKMKHFLRVVLSASYLKTHRVELSYQYSDGVTVCDRAAAAIEDYYEDYYSAAELTVLSEAQRSELDQLKSLVNEYRSAPLTEEFNTAFSLLFLGADDIEQKQAKKFATPAFIEKCKIDTDWLSAHISAERVLDHEVEMDFATLNHFLLYALLNQESSWCEGVENALGVCVRCITDRLGNTETNIVEREQHRRLKESSYAPLVDVLYMLATPHLRGYIDTDSLVKMIKAGARCNFFGVQHALGAVLASDPARQASISKREDIESLLFSAAYDGHLQTLLFLITQVKININIADQDGATALSYAASNGHIDVVDALLANDDINMNAAMYDGGTAFLIAVQEGHADIVNALLKKGADVNAAGWNGFTALLFAARVGHLGVVETLLAAGANANAVDNEGATALFIAAQEGHIGLVNLLPFNEIPLNKTVRELELYASSKALAIRVRMALHIGTAQGSDIVRITPCEIAKIMGHTEILALLESKKARASLANSQSVLFSRAGSKQEVIAITMRCSIM
ncbi:MAG: ankyrin repeat domain-containing protein [Coxiellaceae bacterium]|nr:ankyrin repeat domain-containing protein [Coxiellaceae bacterium]